MKIDYGDTRFVLIFSFITLKIPRIKVFQALAKLTKHSTKNDVYPDKQFIAESSKYGGVWLRGIIACFLAGLFANWRERTYSKSHPRSTALLPTYFLLLGILEIQQTGMVLNDTHPRWQSFVQALSKYTASEQDLLKASNFCLWKGRVCMLDYGARRTIAVLDTGILEVIENLNSQEQTQLTLSISPI